MMLLFLQSIENEEDKELFLQLYENYSRLVYSIANKSLHNHHLSEECVQDVFLLVAKKISQFSLENETYNKNLICCMTRTKIIDYIRMESKYLYSGDVELINVDYFDDIDSVELSRLIDELPEIQKTCLFLKFSYGYTNVDISKLVNYSPMHVGRIINSALKTLKDKLEE